jgi:hypothetical protein
LGLYAVRVVSAPNYPGTATVSIFDGAFEAHDPVEAGQTGLRIARRLYKCFDESPSRVIDVRSYPITDRYDTAPAMMVCTDGRGGW